MTLNVLPLSPPPTKVAPILKAPPKDKKAPGLAVHIPEPLGRESSIESAQRQSLQQLQKLRLELLGEREQQQKLQQEQLVKQQQQQQQKLQPVKLEKEQSRLRRVPVLKGVIQSGDDAPRDQPATETASAASAYYSALRSPISCLSGNQIMKYVNDEDDNSILENHKSKECTDYQIAAPELKITSSIRQVSELTKDSQPGRIITKSRTRLLSTPVQDFDIQKSLERQLAGLPGSMPPGSAGKDEHSYIISSGTKSLESKPTEFKSKASSQRGQLESVVSIVPCDSYTRNTSMTKNGESVFEIRSPQPIASVRTKSKQRRLKRPPKEERAEVVKIDNGLNVMTPNHLKLQMQDFKKANDSDSKESRKQIAQVFEAKDLQSMMAQPNRKSKPSLGSKLKHMLHSPKPIPGTVSTSSSKGNKVEGIHRAKVRDTDDEWYKQTMEQENYKITKVLGNNGKQTITDAPSGNSGKEQGRHSDKTMQIVMATEGDNPILMLPGALAPGLAENKNCRQQQRERFLPLDREELNEKGDSDTLRKRTENTAAIMDELGLQPLTPRQDSFCLSGSPSLATLNDYQINRVINALYRQKAAENRDENMAEEAEKKPSQEAINNARIGILNALKKKILFELRNQKQREEEALARGDPIDEDEKKRVLDEVRRLHARREQVLHISEADIQKAFNRHLVNASDKADQKSSKENYDDEDSDSGVTSLGLVRKNVTFANFAADDELSEVAQPPFPQFGLMSWAQCGINPSVARTDTFKYQKKESENLNKYSSMHAVIGATALKTIDSATRDGFVKAKASVQQCTKPKNEDYFSDDSSIYSANKQRKPKPRSPKPAKKSDGKEKKGKLVAVLSDSGSLKSEDSFDSLDSVSTGTSFCSRDSDSEDSYEGVRRTRRSSVSPRKSRLPSRTSRRGGGRSDQRGYRRYNSSQYSVAGTKYTDYDDADFGCTADFWEPAAFK